jgi:hypothetical protein
LTILPATAVGAGAAVSAGVSWLAFVPNVLAIVVGAVAMVATAGANQTRVVRTLAVVGVVLLAGTLLAPGLDGVHRWLRLGPLQLQVSSAWLPWWCALLLDDDRRWRVRGRWLVVGVQLLHIVQPDAAQATALAVVVAGLRQPLWLVLVMAFGAALAWGQPDPLLPVVHVEQVHELIHNTGGTALGLVAALVLLVVPFRLSTAVPRLLARGAALTLMTSWTLTLVVGAFPCAVFGAGAGAVLGVWGWWCVCVLHRRALSSPTQPSSS